MIQRMDELQPAPRHPGMLSLGLNFGAFGDFSGGFAQDPAIDFNLAGFDRCSRASPAVNISVFNQEKIGAGHQFGLGQCALMGDVAADHAEDFFDDCIRVQAGLLIHIGGTVLINIAVRQSHGPDF